MVIDERYILGTAVDPAEHDAPLVVDADRKLPRPVAPEDLQAIAGQCSQIGKVRGRIKPIKT